MTLSVLHVGLPSSQERRFQLGRIERRLRTHQECSYDDREQRGSHDGELDAASLRQTSRKTLPRRFSGEHLARVLKNVRQISPELFRIGVEPVRDTEEVGHVASRSRVGDTHGDWLEAGAHRDFHLARDLRRAVGVRAEYDKDSFADLDGLDDRAAPS